ncbi:MAG: hypothetical protein WC501_00450 [Candidatus Micrarchaeia archaeon]
MLKKVVNPKNIKDDGKQSKFITAHLEGSGHTGKGPSGRDSSDKSGKGPSGRDSSDKSGKCGN